MTPQLTSSRESGRGPACDCPNRSRLVIPTRSTTAIYGRRGAPMTIYGKVRRRPGWYPMWPCRAESQARLPLEAGGLLMTTTPPGAASSGRFPCHAPARGFQVAVGRLGSQGKQCAQRRRAPPRGPANLFTIITGPASRSGAGGLGGEPRRTWLLGPGGTEIAARCSDGWRRIGPRPRKRANHCLQANRGGRQFWIRGIARVSAGISWTCTSTIGTSSFSPTSTRAHTQIFWRLLTCSPRCSTPTPISGIATGLPDPGTCTAG